MSTALVIGTVAGGGTPPNSTDLGVGIYALTAVVVALLSWMAYLVISSRRSRNAAHEAAPVNLSPPASDDELENRKLTRVLRAALFGSVLLAIALPWYAFNEPGRQAAAAEAIVEGDITAGADLFSVERFACAQCHGPTAGGGAAPFTEARSGVDVVWAVPSLDDVLFRYSEDEIRFWIVFGRAGTPMPANGLEGGGAMSIQEIDQTIAYLKSIQLSQEDAFAKSDGATERAVSAIEGGEARAKSFINKLQIQIDEVVDAKSRLTVVGSFSRDIQDLFQSPGTCTAASAELVGTTCGDEGVDTDRDGLSDATEMALTQMAATALETLSVTAEVPKGERDDESVVEYAFVPNETYDVRFDPSNAFTNPDPDTRVSAPDLDTAETLLRNLGADLLLLGVTADKEAEFLSNLESGMDFLKTSLSERLWEVDFEAVAAEMGVSISDATLGAGLFNAYCARCHTGGYSAGQPFEQSAGAGAWAPSLTNGRAEIQFPDIADQVAFVISGSDNGVKYGINGLGSGRMPGFGQVLSEADIELIVKYERTL